MGKEIIGTVVSRFGKSGMSLALSAVTAWFGSSPWLDRSLLWASQICALLWLLASFRLSKLLLKTSAALSSSSSDKADCKIMKED